MNSYYDDYSVERPSKLFAGGASDPFSHVPNARPAISSINKRFMKTIATRFQDPMDQPMMVSGDYRHHPSHKLNVDTEALDEPEELTAKPLTIEEVTAMNIALEAVVVPGHTQRNKRDESFLAANAPKDGGAQSISMIATPTPIMMNAPPSVSKESIIHKALGKSAQSLLSYKHRRNQEEYVARTNRRNQAIREQQQQDKLDAELQRTEVRQGITTVEDEAEVVVSTIKPSDDMAMQTKLLDDPFASFENKHWIEVLKQHRYIQQAELFLRPNNKVKVEKRRPFTMANIITQINLAGMTLHTPPLKDNMGRDTTNADIDKSIAFDPKALLVQLMLRFSDDCHTLYDGPKDQEDHINLKQMGAEEMNALLEERLFCMLYLFLVNEKDAAIFESIQSTPLYLSTEIKTVREKLQERAEKLKNVQVFFGFYYYFTQ